MKSTRAGAVAALILAVGCPGPSTDSEDAGAPDVTSCPVSRACGATCCQAGQVCQAGVCRVPCADGEIVCGASCCDPATQICDLATSTCAGRACTPPCSGEAPDCVAGSCRCSSSSCTAGRSCVAGACVANHCDPACAGETPDCVGTTCRCRADSCTTGRECVNGACVPRGCSPACAGETPDCVGGRCQCNDDSCGLGRHCADGACVSDCDPACGGETPDCVDTMCRCNDHSCGAGRSCVSGRCADDVCTPRCPTESPLCVGGVCRCVDGSCPTGQTCVSGSCVAGACVPACSGETPLCVSGTCACTSTSCGQGRSCVDRACVADSCSPACGGETPICAGTTCRCDASSCAAGKACLGGVCTPVSTCNPLDVASCPATESCHLTAGLYHCGAIGPGTAGSSCQLAQDCSRGLDCVEAGASPPVKACLAYCDPARASTCTGTCLDLHTGVGSCVPVECDLLTQNCTAPLACYPGLVGTQCHTAGQGTGPDLPTCTAQRECTRGHGCNTQGQCGAFCDPTHPCVPTEACRPLAGLATGVCEYCPSEIGCGPLCCGADQVCDPTTKACTACGGDQQPCCAAGTCQSGMACTGGTCGPIIPCDPLAPSACVAGTGCFRDPVTSSFRCQPAGTVPTGGACTLDSLCQAGDLCAGGTRCGRACSTSASGSCASGQVCSPLGAGTLGTCTPCPSSDLCGSQCCNPAEGLACDAQELICVQCGELGGPCCSGTCNGGLCQAGICQPCDLFTQNCPAGMGCYSTPDRMCFQAGTLAPGATCTAFSQCLPGYGCGGTGSTHVCGKNCLPPPAANACSASEACTASSSGVWTCVARPACGLPTSFSPLATPLSKESGLPAWALASFRLDAGPERLQLALVAGQGPLTSGISPGTYTLTSADLSAATCGICLVVTDSTGRSYMPTAGQVTLQSVTPTLAGTLAGIALREVTIDEETFATTPVTGGCESTLSTTSFTTPMP